MECQAVFWRTPAALGDQPLHQWDHNGVWRGRSRTETRGPWGRKQCAFLELSNRAKSVVADSLRCSDIGALLRIPDPSLRFEKLDSFICKPYASSDGVE